MYNFKLILMLFMFIHKISSQHIYIGCYLDNDLRRDLNGTYYKDLSYSLNIEKCVNFCYQNYFTFSGLQLK